MECFYYIQLPKGGEVKISANFTKLSPEDNNLMEMVNSYINSYLSASKDDLKKLREKIRTYTNTGLHWRVIDTMLDNVAENDKTAEDFINGINERIDSKLNITEVNDALFALLKNNNIKIEKIKDGVTSTISLADFFNEISKTVSKNYFSRLNINTIINMESVNSKLQEIGDKIDDYDKIGISTTSLKSLKTIIKLAFPMGMDGDLRNTNVFFNASFDTGLNTSIVIKNKGYLPTIFYNDSNELSMFLGIFGYYASKLNPEDVLPILEEYNKKFVEANQIKVEDLDLDKIFIGYFDEGGVYHDPEFLKILKSKSKAKKTMDLLIKLVANELVKNSSRKDLTEYAKIISQDLSNLFLFISPNVYGHQLYDLEKQNIDKHRQDTIENLEQYHREKRMLVRDFINSSVIDYYYARPERKVFTNTEDLHAFGTTIRPYKDVITLTLKKGEVSRLVVITKVKNSAKGIRVTGFYTDQGSIIDLKEYIEILPNESFNFRKLENEEPVEIDASREDAVPLHNITEVVEIQSEKGVPSNIVKGLIVKGSAVKYKYTNYKTGKDDDATNIANKIYPNLILGNRVSKSGKAYPIDYSNIIKFTAPLSSVEGIDKFTSLNNEQRKEFLSTKEEIRKRLKDDYLPIFKGDFVRTKEGMHNEVIAVDKENVYILIKTLDKQNKAKTIYKVTPIDRNTIEVVFTDSKKEIDKQTMEKIFNEYLDIVVREHSVRDSTYSYFLSPVEAQDGDFVITTDGIMYKIISKEHSYGVYFTGKGQEYSKIDFTKAKMFITGRDISTEDSITIADVNNFRLVTANSSDDIDKYPADKANGYTLVPAKYAIPTRIKKDPVLLPSGNFNIGSVRWGDIPIGKDFVDVTKELVGRFNKVDSKNATKGPNLYLFQKKEGAQIMRYNKNLHEYTIVNRAGDVHSNYNKFKDALKKEAYVTFSKVTDGEYRFSSKIYKITSYDAADNSIIVEYAGINNSGNYITIRKRINVDEAFENKTIKAIYVLKDSKLFHYMEQSLDKKLPKSSVTEKDVLIENVANKMKSLFDIDTVIENIGPSKGRINKAWVNQDDNGKIVVHLNKYTSGKAGTYLADESDVVHEFMHVFLTALRYSRHKGLYDEIIEAYRKEKMDGKTLHAFEIEEELVKYLSTEMLENGVIDEPLNLKGALFNGIITSIMGISEDLDISDFKELGISDLESLLNKNMSQILRTKARVNPEMKNANMIYFDANFRQFLESSIKNQTIKIECN